MTKYEESLRRQAVKISAIVGAELIDYLYEGILAGKVEFTETGLKKAINDYFGDRVTLESFNLKFDGIYQSLKHRLETMEDEL